MKNICKICYNKCNNLESNKRHDNSFFLLAEKYQHIINDKSECCNKQQNDNRKIKMICYIES